MTLGLVADVVLREHADERLLIGIEDVVDFLEHNDLLLHAAWRMR